LVGEIPGWFGPEMPRNKAGAEALFSTEFKDMVKNPKYH